jgi:TetR/AcrR family transcriptional repressor of nem operon
MADAAATDNPNVGLGMLATIVGAITLARATDDDGLARSILSAALAQVTAQDGAVA